VAEGAGAAEAVVAKAVVRAEAAVAAKGTA
jgi:hypothetical protein